MEYMAKGDLKTVKNEYLEYLEIERSRAAKTIENYGRYLDRFIRFAHSAGSTSSPQASSGQAKDMDVSGVTEELIRQYRLHLNRITDDHGESLKRVTQNYHIIALRNLLKYLAKRGIRCVPAERVELGKQEDRQVSFLEPQELERFLQGPQGSELAVLRDRAILNMLFSTGMRVSELCSLNRDTVDLNRGEVTVRGKGGKIRPVFLSDDAREHTKTYLAKRPDADEALFIRIPKHQAFSKATGLRLTPRSVQRIVAKYAVRAGIMGKKVSPHTLRHSFATDLLRGGADIRSVQALLGHSSVTTTQIYTHVTDKGLRDVHKKFHHRRQA